MTVPPSGDDSPATVRRMARQERAELAAFLATLSPEDWRAPSLCQGWRVHDVVAHLVSYDELDGRGLLARLAKARLRLGRANALGVTDYADRSPRDLLALLTAHLEPRGLPAAFGGMVALVDGMIHHQDIRRPLGRPRDIPPDRLRRALGLALLAPPIGAFRRARGLRLVAPDLDWSTGSGPEVRGPGEALLLGLAGRRVALADLSGPGQPKLAARLGD